MAATKNAGDAGQAAALPVAVVLRLPTAAAEPVQQQPKRRGRHPKSVTTLWRVRQEREPLRRVIRLRAQLDLIRTGRQDAYRELCRGHSEVVEMRKRVDALEAVCAGREAVYAELDRMDNALCAELAALGARVPTYCEFLGLAG